MHADELMKLIDDLGPRIAEDAAERDEKDAFFAHHEAALKEHGLTTMLIPVELGGLGVSHATACAVLRRLAQHDGSVALTLSMHTHAVGLLAFRHARGASPTAKMLADIAENRRILVSTGGRDWLESNGAMTRVEGGFRVTARKAFASGAPLGDRLVTSAPFHDPEQGWQVLHFSLPMTREGVRIGDDWRAHGMRSTGSNTVYLDDVFVPDDAIALRRPRAGFHPVWHAVLGIALPLIMAPYVGVAEAAADAARSRAARRRGDPVVQMTVGEMDSALFAAQALHERMVRVTGDFGFEPSLSVSNEMLALKSAVSSAVRRTTEAAMDAAGGAAFVRPHGIERLLRDARAAEYHPLPARVQCRLTGRVALGLDPFESVESTEAGSGTTPGPTAAPSDPESHAITPSRTDGRDASSSAVNASPCSTDRTPTANSRDSGAGP